MVPKRIIWIGALVLVLGTLGAVWALSRNVAPDAVTKATEGYNVYTGELAYLTDGKYPGNDDAPGILKWGNKGVLVFELAEPVSITEVTICVGDNPASWTVSFFLGAKLGADGQARDPAGESRGYVENYDFATNQWVALRPEAAVVADYVEVETMDGPEIYEIEILAEDGNSVRPSSWGFVKSQFAH